MNKTSDKDDTLHAPSYDKGYDANKKDYDAVWADLDKSHKVIRGLADVLGSMIAIVSNVVSDNPHQSTRINELRKANETLAKAKEFLK